MQKLVGQHLRIEKEIDGFFEGSPYDLIIASYPDESKVARYYITYLDGSLFEKVFRMSDSHEPEVFRRFQSQLLEGEFFSLNNDLRWNLYLILVTPTIVGLPNDAILQMIERDEDYARKSVVREDELGTYLERVRFRESVKQKRAIKTGTQLVSIWTEKLQTAGLKGCLETYFSRNIDEYCVNGHSISFNQSLGDSPGFPQEESGAPRIMAIGKVIMEGFRSHCFGENFELELASVSLLAGPNGSGKTSILEGMEFAITGEIRRLKNWVHDQGATSVLCVDEKGNRVVIRSDEDRMMNKLREQEWYGVPAGRGKATLGHNFSMFNYLDCEKAYSFASDKANEFDFNSSLGQLFFGEEIMRMERNLKRHWEAFCERQTKLEKDRREKELLLRDRELLLKNLEAYQGQEEEAILKEVFESGNRVGLKKQFRGDALNTQITIGQILAVYQSVSDNLEFIKKTAQRLHIPTIVDLKQKEEKLRTSRMKLKESEAALREEKEQILALESNIHSDKKRLQDIKRQKAGIVNTKILWIDYARVLENPGLAKQRRDLEKEKQELTARVNLLQKILMAHPDIMSWTADDVAELPDTDVAIIRANLSSLKKKMRMLESKTIEVSAQLDALELITTQIQSFGQQYSDNLLDESTFRRCPLCGFDHGSTANLRQQIDGQRSGSKGNTQDVVLRFRSDINYLQTAIQEQQNRLDSLELSRQQAATIRMIFADLENSFSVSDIEAMASRDILTRVQKKLSELESIRTLLDSVNCKCAVLDSRGFKLDLIERADRFVIENPDYLRFTMSDTGVSFLEFLQQDEVILNQKIEELGKRIEIEETRIKTREIDYSEKRMDLEICRKNVEKLGHVLDGFSAHLSAVDQYFELEDEDEFVKLAERIFLAQRHADASLESLDRIYQIEEIKEHITQLREELRDLERLYQRCGIAISELGELPTTSQFLQDFLEEYRQDIERLFLQLHTPREFIGIRLTNGNLQLERGNGDIIEVFQTSFGQRVALALSLLLTRHLVAPNAPKFLMLDDPVTHLDDIHLLNLLDVLRELAINGHQIIITSANVDVSMLLRRKFSFLGSEYKEFSLVRKGDCEVLVFEKTFEYDSEKVIRRMLPS